HRLVRAVLTRRQEVSAVLVAGPAQVRVDLVCRFGRYRGRLAPADLAPRPDSRRHVWRHVGATQDFALDLLRRGAGAALAWLAAGRDRMLQSLEDASAGFCRGLRRLFLRRRSFVAHAREPIQMVPRTESPRATRMPTTVSETGPI